MEINKRKVGQPNCSWPSNVAVGCAAVCLIFCYLRGARAAGGSCLFMFALGCPAKTSGSQQLLSRVLRYLGFASGSSTVTVCSPLWKEGAEQGEHCVQFVAQHNFLNIYFNHMK